MLCKMTDSGDTMQQVHTLLQQLQEFEDSSQVRQGGVLICDLFLFIYFFFFGGGGYRYFCQNKELLRDKHEETTLIL